MSDHRKHYTGAAVGVSFDAGPLPARRRVCTRTPGCLRHRPATMDPPRRRRVGGRRACGGPLPDGCSPHPPDDDDCERAAGHPDRGDRRSWRAAAPPRRPALDGSWAASTSTRPAPRSAHVATRRTRRTATAEGPAPTGLIPAAPRVDRPCAATSIEPRSYGRLVKCWSQRERRGCLRPASATW